MKHYTYCHICGENQQGDIIAVGEIRSDLNSICTCPNGHTFISGLMHELFDILYLSGVEAFYNGHYSESIMSFTASLERTYEFFVKVTLLKEGLTLDLIDDFWKGIKNQSERQLGAFCTQYLKVTKTSWHLNTNMVAFRNNVIHKGHISGSDDVIKYVEYTTTLQMNILNILKADYEKERSSLFFHQKQMNRNSIDILQKETGFPFVATSSPSLLKWNYTGQQKVTFSDALTMYIDFFLKHR